MESVRKAACIYFSQDLNLKWFLGKSRNYCCFMEKQSLADLLGKNVQLNALLSEYVKKTVREIKGWIIVLYKARDPNILGVV